MGAILVVIRHPLLPRQMPPLKKTGRKYRNIKDLLGYYRAHYDGMTRSKLARRDHYFYRKLCQAGLLTHIPLERHGYRDIGDPLAYYRKHYVGVPRGKLQRIDASLYGFLCRARLMQNVPKATIVKRKKRRKIGDLLAYTIRSISARRHYHPDPTSTIT